jgi:zinc transport system substrate-binding protein
MFRFIIVIPILIALISLVSCKGKRDASDKMQLTVSIIPQKYLVSFIAGGKFDVQAMLPKGSNHETYEPAPRDMEKISNSELYLAIGALDFEITWLDRLKASNPGMKVINTSQGIEMLAGQCHSYVEGSAHKSHGKDPHTWLSPACMKIQATNICEALSEIDTLNASFYKSNLAKFISLADSVHCKIRSTLAASEGKTILIFHPALAYFARDYQLTQVSIEQDGKEPSPAYLGELIKLAKEKGIKSIFISKEFDTRNAESIAREMNGKVVTFDPMNENWPDNLIRLAELIAEN